MKKWAKNELDLLSKGSENCDIQNMMNEQLMEIVELFCTHGHSNFSAPYAVNKLKRLLMRKPITKLAGTEDEWVTVIKDEDGTQQNKRCSAVFRRNNDNSTAFYIEGKVFSEDGGKTWFTNKDSRVSVEFPFWVPDEPERIILK